MPGHSLLYSALLLTGIVLGSQYILINLSLAEVTVLGLSAFRLLFSSAFMFAAIFLTGSWREIGKIKPIAQCFLLAIFGEVIAPLAIAYASRVLSSSTVGLGVSAAPFVTVLIASQLFPDEKFSRNQVLALLLNFSGVAVLLLRLPAIAALIAWR